MARQNAVSREERDEKSASTRSGARGRARRAPLLTMLIGARRERRADRSFSARPLFRLGVRSIARGAINRRRAFRYRSYRQFVAERGVARNRWKFSGNFDAASYATRVHTPAWHNEYSFSFNRIFFSSFCSPRAVCA